MAGRQAQTTTPDSVEALKSSGVTEDQQRDLLLLINVLSRSARVGNRTTRKTLAITGFALLGVAVVAIFGVSGQGVRDLRSQVVAALERYRLEWRWTRIPAGSAVRQRPPAPSRSS